MAFGIDDAALIGGLATVAAAGTSAIASGKMNKRAEKFNEKEAERQRQWNEAMAEKQNAWNYEMWLEQNEYNSPAAQVERLRAAGLNPLYYGLDGSTAGEITAAQPLGYERASAPNYQNVVGAGLDAAAKVAQISNIQADTAKKNNENLTETQRREKIIQDIANAKQELENMKAEEGLTKSRKEQLDIANNWYDRILEASLAETESKIQLNKANKKRIDELLEGEKLLQAKSLEDFDHKWQKIYAEIEKMSSETGLNHEELANYALYHANNGFMGTGLSGQNLILFLQELLGKNPKPKNPDQEKNQADAMATIVDNKY